MLTSFFYLSNPNNPCRVAVSCRKEVRQQIRTKEVKFEGKVWGRISKDAKDFVLRLLQRNPDNRPTAKEALKHKFIQNRSKLSSEPPNPDIVRNIPGSMLHFGESSNLKKIALQIIASRSSSDEIFELRQVFDEYDKSCDGSLSYSDFKDCLSRLNFTDAELKSMFDQVVRIAFKLRFVVLPKGEILNPVSTLHRK